MGLADKLASISRKLSRQLSCAKAMARNCSAHDNERTPALPPWRCTLRAKLVGTNPNRPIDLTSAYESAQQDSFDRTVVIGCMGCNPLFRWLALNADSLVGKDSEARRAGLKAAAEKP